MIRHLLKGAIGPKDNDSRYLLDVHRRDLPGEETMCRYPDSDEVDLCVVGAGAGGSVLAQRLARRGWKVVILEAGPFWHPDEDWVSDEAGSHELYWTQKRIIGGSDPIELGKNNSGRGVGGSMVHYAGYCPRFHPSDLQTMTLDGIGADWPISYQQMRPHYERVETELPVAGQHWPWGYPHSYPFSPHPISEAASVLWRGALAQGITMRVGPVGIVNGTFGNRPHCIYRGYCLQGCKVNAKASPYVTHLPDALAHSVEIRANCMASRIDFDPSGGRATGVAYIRESEQVERLQRAKVVAVAGYSIETPRLLLNSATKSFPNGLCNNEDQVGRYVMVQGATQAAGRFPTELRMYKAPPPEVSSEDFYETDASRGFARGFSIQTVSPEPIGWAEHVLAGGHWGRALREYMRDYNHWTTIGVLNELLPQADNRVTLADEKDPYGLPVARFDHSLCDQLWLQAPGAHWMPADEQGIPLGAEAVTGTPYDFRAPRPVGSTRLDTGYAELERDQAGLAYVELSDRGNATTVRLWMDDSYRYLMLFSGDSLPDPGRRRRGLGVEPMTCAPNALQSGQGLRTLQPGESFASTWGISPGPHAEWDAK